MGERSFDGTSLSVSLAFGGSLRNGIVLGGALMIDRILGLSGTDEQGATLDLGGYDFTFLLIGPFLDVYPDPGGGLHLQAALGLATLGVSRPQNAQSSNTSIDDPSGVGVALGAGWELWLGDDVSAGALLRVSWAPLDVQESQTPAQVDVLTPALLLTGTYN